MIRVDDRIGCSGCTACQSVCPHDAIEMKADAIGFRYPAVDMNLCVDCGLCEKVCDFVKPCADSPKAGFSVMVNAARHRDPASLASSQSGGTAAALAEMIISMGGAVYGAGINPDFTVSHSRAVTLEECESFKRSKYVQSDLSGVFRMVMKDLKDGMKVLFTGTPCQVAGLSSFIPESLKENLLLVDMVCHGVPSPAVWKDYVAFMARKGTISEIVFRNKDVGGWKMHNGTIRYSDGRIVVNNTFNVLFYKNIMFRPSCRVCPYHINNRKSDIIVSDFWGVGEILPEFDGPTGTSMVIANTHRGEEYIERLKDSLDMKQVELSDGFLMRRNPNLFRPTRMDKDCVNFERKYTERGFLYVARRWGDIGWRFKAWKLKVFVKNLLGIR